MCKLIVCFLLGLMITSCVMHAPYERPYVEIPCTWRVDANDITTAINMRWWEQFKDPILNSLIVEALQNNLDLKVAIARVWEYYAILGITAADLYPEINGTATVSRSEVSLKTLSTPPPVGFLRIRDLFKAALNMSYELDIWGKFKSATEAAFANLLAQEEAKKTVVVTLVSAVASSYVLLRQYDKELQISKETLLSRQQSYDLAKLRFEGGLTSELEVKQAESEVQDALAEVKQFEILVPQQENLLSILVGRNPQAIERGRRLSDLKMPPCVPEGIPSEILEQRPDIKQAEYLLASANAQVGEAKALYFPQINLTGSYGSESFELCDLFTGPARTWQYGVSLYQSFFDAGKIYYQVSATEAKVAEAHYHYLFAIQNAFREVDDALIAHQKSLELVQVEAKRVAVLTDYLYLATLQYENGQTDYLNVLDAQRNLFSAQLSYAEAQGDSFLTLINIYKALGGGWVIDADNIVCF